MGGLLGEERKMSEGKKIDIVLCKNCFHREVCEAWASCTTIKLEDIPPEIPCGHFKNSADIAPRAEWISVEERIPKNFESVLVLATRLEDDEYDVLVAYHDRGDWEEQHTRRYESPICGEIKYWMPLPDPTTMKGGAE